MLCIYDWQAGIEGYGLCSIGRRAEKLIPTQREREREILGEDGFVVDGIHAYSGSHRANFPRGQEMNGRRVVYKDGAIYF